VTDHELTLLVARVFANKDGKELVQWMRDEWSVITGPWVEERCAKAAAIWSTGGSVSDAGGSRDS
jgi:hypothetical protein